MTKGKKKNGESVPGLPGSDEERAQATAAGPVEPEPSETPAGPATVADAAAAGLQAAVQEAENRLLRLQADFDNYRRRTLRERDELWQRAHAELIGELLPVLDHLDLALESAKAHEAPAAFTEGIRLVSDQLRTVLQKFGLTPFDAIGAVFDTSRHEAVVHAPSSEVEENRVMAQTRRGYTIGERLLRPAQVVVSSGAPAVVAAQSEGG